jgi:hypothetical protein
MMGRAGFYRGLASAAALIFSVTGASAQLKPWPDQQPQPPQTQTRPWPGESQAAATPQAAIPQPSMSGPPPMNAGPPPMMGGPMGPPPGAQRENPCMEEFMRLRSEVEKSGKFAKAVNDRHGTRDEFCKAFTGLHASQARWVSYTQKNASKCGIPPDVIKQLKIGEANLNKMRNNACNGGGAAAGAPAPSLSEALGTARLPVPDSNDAAKKRGGTLDTLTGEAIR